MAIDAALVARLFDLGEPRSEPVPLVGNGTAGAWRLDTGTGRWAVKAVRAAEPWELAAMPALIEAAVSAYAERGGRVGTADAVAFTGLLRGMLEWAANNLALAGPPGPAVVKPSVRAEAVAQLSDAAKVLPVIVRSIDRWANLLESAST